MGSGFEYLKMYMKFKSSNPDPTQMQYRFLGVVEGAFYLRTYGVQV
jgi:hypothetical protein